MNFDKRLFIAAAVAVSATAPFVAEAPASAATGMFKDIPTTHSHYIGITQLAKQGIISGVSATEFDAYKDATRAEAVEALAKALNLDTKNVKNPGFKDVPTTAKYYGAVAALYEKGIIGGFTDGTFQPNGVLKRSQFAKMLTLGFDLAESNVRMTNFKDVNVISDAATKRYIITLLDYGITKGTTTTSFSPYVTLKRGQLATFLYNAMQSVNEEFTVISID